MPGHDGPQEGGDRRRDRCAYWLQAMADAPDQFGSTYEREAARSTDDWQRWFAPGATFIFENSSGPVGLAAGVWADGEPSVVYLMAVWVHPSARGTGAGHALVNAVLAWSESAGAKTVRLDVVEGNTAASALRASDSDTCEMIAKERDGVTGFEWSVLSDEGSSVLRDRGPDVFRYEDVPDPSCARRSAHRGGGDRHPGRRPAPPPGGVLAPIPTSWVIKRRHRP